MGITAKNGSSVISLNKNKDVWQETVLATGLMGYISRDELFCIVSKISQELFFDLTPEEEADILDWNSQPIKLVVEERFINKGFTWHEMEQWIAGCYRMDSNPMPHLRDILAGYLPDAIYYVSVFKCRDWSTSFYPGLTCIHDRRNSSPKKPITLVAHGTFEEVVAKRAERERMRKIAGLYS